MSKAALEELALEEIPRYVLEQNRPYNPTDVYTNLRQKFGKTLVIKALDAAVENGILKAKLITKTKIYYPDQDKFEQLDDGAMTDLDAKIAELSQRREELNTRYRSLTQDLNKYKISETTDKLLEMLPELNLKIAEMKERIEQLESAGTTDLESSGKLLQEECEKLATTCRKRKRIAGDMFSAIQDGCGLPKKQLIEKLGVEWD